MRKRRVGTLSMGVLLVGSGIFLLYAQIYKNNALDIVANWWPIILFMLGIEVLWYSFSSKEDNAKLKYDIFSIFIIFMIVVSSIGIYGLSQFGITQRLTMMMSAQNYMLPLPGEEFALDDTIRKIVIDSPRSDVSIRQGNENKVILYGNANVTADNRETAEKLIAPKMMVGRKAGDTLYLSFSVPHSSGDMSYRAWIEKITLIIPGDRIVEVKSDNSIELYADSFKNQLSIESSGMVKVKASENSDCQIAAYVTHKDNLRGNLDWTIIEPISPGQNEEQEHEKMTVGKLLFGQGSCKINIIGKGEIEINKI